jgi:endo-1,4-beta-xylanase
MVVPASKLRFATFSSIIALCFCTAQARAEAGAGGTSGAGAGGTSSGGTTAAGTGGTGGASAGSGGAATGGVDGQSGGPATAGASSSAGAGGSAPVTGNLITNGTFDTSKGSWWSYAANAADAPSDIVLDATTGELCGTMTMGGKNVWDVIIGISDLSLVKDQAYHISFTVHADAPRTIKFKSGLGVAPYTDYFIEPIAITATSQKFDYTYLNLRTDPTAQFQFQIGKSPGTVCVDNVVLEPVPTPAQPVYKTSAPSGHPFRDYSKIVKMGTAVDTPIFLSNPVHNSIVAAEFSMITPANSMKMNLIHPTETTFDFTDTDALYAWSKANNLEFRGHPLVWHTQAPGWLTTPTTGTGTDGAYTRDELIAIMYAHIDALIGHYPELPYWDVVNEAIDNADYRQTFWFKTIGAEFIDLAFKRAREKDPDTKLFYNDYNIEQKGDAKADRVFALVKDLKDRGIPIDGIGFQGHYFVEKDGSTANGVPDMQAIRDNMARYAEIGVEVQVTESDFRIGKPLDGTKTELQNKFYADFLQACIDAPNCSHFTVWGLSDQDSWVPSTFPEYDFAHLFDKDLKPKPDYTAMSQVFAKYNPADGTLLGMGGSGGAAPVPPTSSGSSDSGGCSFAPHTGGSALWLLAAFGMVSGLLVRRRKA